MQIYFDCCCLCRPYDDLSSNVIHLEAEAILSVIDYCESGEWENFSSDVLYDEISGITNLYKRDKVLVLYHSATIHIDLTAGIVSRAKELEQYGLKSYDALHMASAEAGAADVLLTTDKGFINAARRSDSKIPVRNPLAWLAEVLYETES